MVKRTLIFIIALTLFLGTSSSFGAYEWVLLDGELNIPRHALTGEALNGYVYAIGGIVSGGTAPSDSQNAVSRYDPASDSWSLVDSMPTARHSLSSDVIDGWIYAVGGHVVNSRSENQRYNGTSWESRASVYARSSPGVAAYNGELYVFGGNRYATILSRVDIYDPDTDTWRSGCEMPAATCPGRAVTLGDIIYVNYGDDPKELWAYDPVGYTWDTSIPLMNVSRGNYELQAVNGRIYAIGGSNGSSYSSSVESWAPGDTSWRMEPSLNIARNHFASAVIGNDIYIFGGYNGGDLGSTEVLTLCKPPVASFTYLPEKPMVGGNISFDASSSHDSDGIIVSYEWDFGDEPSETSQQPQIEHLFKVPKTYIVTLTVTDDDGLTGSTYKKVELTLKNGDLLLWRSPKSPFGRLGILFWTHVGIYYEPSNKVIEARREYPVMRHPLSDWFFDEKTCVQALEVKTDQATRDAAVNFAMDRLGLGYDLCSALSDLKQDGTNFSDLDQRWYCSELVWAAYLSASNGQINLDPGMGAVSPDEINNPVHVNFLGAHMEDIPGIVLAPWLFGSALSPVDLIVTDPDGLILNKQGSEIPEAVYQELEIDGYDGLDDFFAIPEPKDGDYLYELIGTEGGTYGLNITLVSKGEEVTFEASEIPTSQGARHVYAVDWQALSAGEEGVILEIDKNGDGFFEQMVIADNELSYDELALQTETVVDFDPDTLNLKSKRKFVTVYIELPVDFDSSEIDIFSLELNELVPPLPKPIEIGDYDSDGTNDLMVKFDRQELIAVLEPGEQIIALTGRLWDGRPLGGFDIIRVIH